MFREFSPGVRCNYLERKVHGLLKYVSSCPYLNRPPSRIDSFHIFIFLLQIRLHGIKFMLCWSGAKHVTCMAISVSNGRIQVHMIQAKAVNALRLWCPSDCHEKNRPEVAAASSAWSQDELAPARTLASYKSLRRIKLPWPNSSNLRDV